MKRIDLSGQRFGRLVVIERYTGATKKTAWICRCDCDAQTVVRATNLVSGNTTSCGCYRVETKQQVTHGHALGTGVSREYNTYNNMISRCYAKYNNRYHRYGGRGITVCERWLESFSNFYEDMGDKPEGMSIDRKNNSGNYEPGNCRWATKEMQARNASNSKLNSVAVRVIRWFCQNTDYTNQRIADAYGVSNSLIQAIATNQTWRNV